MATPAPEGAKAATMSMSQFYIGIIGVLIAASGMTLTVLDRIDKQTDKITQAMVRAALADDHIQNMQTQIAEIKAEQREQPLKIQKAFIQAINESEPPKSKR